VKNSDLEEFVKAMGVSDEDVAKITPELEDTLVKSMAVAEKYRLVFEVKRAKNCLLGVQVGQKIVVDNMMIDKDATDCPMCMGLVGTLLPLNLVFYDRCLTGNVTDPMPEGVSCVDPGLDCPEAGGLGSVVMTARIEPKEG
jgi:hypothetical protein